MFYNQCDSLEHVLLTSYYLSLILKVKNGMVSKDLKLHLDIYSWDEPIFPVVFRSPYFSFRFATTERISRHLSVEKDFVPGLSAAMFHGLIPKTLLVSNNLVTLVLHPSNPVTRLYSFSRVKVRKWDNELERNTIVSQPFSLPSFLARDPWPKNPMVSKPGYFSKQGLKSANNRLLLTVKKTILA
jgi:hypothetical protein